MVNKLIGIDVRATTNSFQDLVSREEQWRSSVGDRQVREDQQAEFLHRRLVAQTELLRRKMDNIDALKLELAAVRNSSAYVSAVGDSEPLVSVRIASYRKTEELVDVAIASILRQTYERFEIVVVNDGPNDRTRLALDGLRDSRIRYFELDARGKYPDDPRSRWMVAGTAAANLAAELSKGHWVAPLDDDDEFLPDHIAKLLKTAQDASVELAYGALSQKNLINNTEARIWSYPPAISQFSFQASIYIRALCDVFRFDPDAWLLDEPGDWNLIRRMSAAGVTMAAISDTVTNVNMVPYTHKVDD